MNPHPVPSRVFSLLRIALFLATAGGASFGAAQIIVENPAGTALAYHAANFPAVTIPNTNVGSSSAAQTFTIENSGDAVLTITSITTTGGNSADFSVTSVPSSVPAASGGTNGSATFTVTFSPAARGARTTTLQIVSSDATKSPFNITLNATGLAAEIIVEDPGGTALTYRAATPYPSYSFADTSVGGTSGAQTFTIENSGNIALSITSITTTGGNSGEFAVANAPTTVPAATGGNNGSATFTVTFNPAGRGNRTTTLAIVNGDGTKTPFNITLNGAGLAPEITVLLDNTPFSTGAAAHSFGSVGIGGARNLDFTIRNDGTSDLTGIALSFAVQNRDFEFLTQPSATLAAGNSATFTVQFHPTIAGNQTAQVSIANNDPDGSESPFVVNLSGSGNAPSTSQDDFGYQLVEQPGGQGVPFLDLNDPEVINTGVNGPDKSIPIDIGFNFFFYESSYDQCHVKTTGRISFGEANRSDIDFTPDPIPSTSAPNHFIAPFWTDLRVGPQSRIVYKRSGIAPNRRLTVMYHNVEQYDTNTKRVTFQVQLYEGTNTIEIQYKDETPSVAYDRPSTAQNGHEFSIGIESRAYGPNDDFPPVAPATERVLGIPYKQGVLNRNTLAFPLSIQFRRPVLVTVESKYDMPNPVAGDPPIPTDVGSLALGLNPPIGTIYGTPVGTVKRFEAPQYIYLNEAFTVLTEAGDANETDVNKRAVYRLVNDGYAIDGQVVQGTTLFFTTTLSRDVTVIWRWKLQYAVFVEAASSVGGAPINLQDGVGEPDPVIGRSWYDKGTDFTASINRVSSDEFLGSDVGGYRYTTQQYNIGPKGVFQEVNKVDVGDTGPRVTTDSMTIETWTTVQWIMSGQVRYRFNAAGSDANASNAEFRGQSFVRIDDPELSRTTAVLQSETDVIPVPFGFNDGTDLVVTNVSTSMTLVAGTDYSVTPGLPVGSTNGSVTIINTNASTTGDTVRVHKPTSTFFGVANSNEVWLDIGTQVEIGAFYRSEDRCVTLQDFPVPPGGDLGTVGTDISDLDDATYNEVGFLYTSANHPNLGLPRVARVFDTVATAPTEVRFLYGPTVFRAEIPLGQSLDALNPNAVLVPDLCDGAVLRAGALGPEDTFIRVGPEADGTAIGTPARWDQLGKSLFPVHPASFRLDWPDENDPAKSYKIEIVSGYPGAQVTLASERETEDGMRINIAPVGADPVYDTTTVLERVSNDFPGRATTQALDAHYRHLFDPNPSRRPPSKLDLFATDQWHFEEMPFTDRTANVLVDDATPGTPFTPQGEGRCVLLYNFRPNPDEIADGTLNEENLAVRVVRCERKTPLLPDDPKLVLGRRGLDLDGAKNLGIIQTGTPAPASVAPGSEFVIDFWLNASSFRPDDAEVTILGTMDDQLKVTLSNNLSSTTVTLQSESETIPLPFSFAAAGDIQVTNISTGLALSSGTDYSASPGSPSGSVTLIDTPAATIGDSLRVEIVPPRAPASNISATYRGVTVTHPFSTAGNDWRHYVIHVFRDEFFGTAVTIVDFYADGVREEKGVVTASLAGGPPVSTVGTSVTADSVRFGVGADPASKLQLDQFRLFTLPASNTSAARTGSGAWLSSGELRILRTERTAMLRARSAGLWFNFEGAPAQGAFANSGTIPNLGVGLVPPDANNEFPGIWARLDIQEVATRLNSTLDNAGFGGSGYILNRISNYNANLYDRSAEIGTWGPVFPVNHGRLFTTANRRLEIAYYENPFRTDESIHPNVAWPYEAAGYDEIVFPTHGPHRDKAIYIASRLGSEGVDRNGKLQQVFGLDQFANLAIYHQPSTSAPGYNPNEEHALAAGSNRAALKVKVAGEEIPNNPPLAAFALQNDVNVTSGSGYTSDPWVLVQVDDLSDGDPEMAAYEVFKVRDGAVPFPRPTDSEVAAVAGLEYESASAPENRFLTMEPDRAYDLNYRFEYLAAAGDLLIPPYPLNLVIGSASMQDARGGNIEVSGSMQRAFWRDVNRNAWVVSGDGRFFYQFFYPHRGDFYLPGSPQAGTPVAWLPDDGATFLGDNVAAIPADDSPRPVPVVYNTFWRSDYPKLKRGETLTYQGGEYFNETPGSEGLPALVAMAAAEVVYDSATPGMVINDSNVENYTARIIRALDRRELPFRVADMAAADFSPASPSILVVAERWYFADLSGSLQKRFYFDSLAEKLVFRGYLNDKDSGDPDLTAGPDPINVLEPNVMTPDELAELQAISGNSNWLSAVQSIFDTSQAPHPVRRLSSGGVTDIDKVGRFLAGVQELPEVTLLDAGLTDLQRTLLQALDAITNELEAPWRVSQFFESLYRLTRTPVPDDSQGKFVHLNSFGVGSALVPNPSLLTSPITGSSYITIAENNRAELAGAPISLHIIEIVPDRYRGAIKVLEGADAFSEKVTLQHNGEFGANTGDLYYEWWIRDAAPLGVINNPDDREVRADGTLKEVDLGSGQSLWQQYLPKARAENNSLTEEEKHLGLHTIIFEGRPDVTLADKLVLMRYRHKDESGWKLVPFEITDPVAEWKPGNVTPVSPAPFQWAGAANSPQIQASGEKLYIPQLVMGWVKRVLDRINPYEARYTDFFSTESPATYSSQIQIAGPPFAGKVALNPDKNVIENTGLIELYETVLARAKELTIENTSNPVSTDGVNQAILLAATRLAVLYELLAREAYSDAQDSTITVSDDGGLASVVSYTHAFQNLESDLLHEELALLRGTDFRKSYPVFNRMFWNYTKGLGEAAYNVNYNIYDENTDGFINEDDARALYPQGHGDSWGHFVSALGMHYELLRQPVYVWRSRSELYSLMQNVLEVDYLDEKTFAKLAAGKARAGRDIVRGTYRLHYTQDPDGQWQGYGDGADPARAWGVSEWAHRAGQATYFDWAVANSLLAEEAEDGTPVPNPENLDRIQRSTAAAEIGSIAGGLLEIQNAMDEANNGVNPLGFDSDALTFDLNVEFYENASGGDRRSHFEQIYNRAVTAGTNAMATLSFAAQADNKLRRLADNTDALIVEALRQDLDYRNRLIEIFGRPYDGTIGFGKVYPEGYLGPDTLLYSYLDRTTINQIVPQLRGTNDRTTANFNTIYVQDTLGVMDNSVLVGLYNDVWGDTNGPTNLDESFVTLIGDNDYHLEAEVGDLSVPYDTASEYGFVAPPEWGRRTSYGRAQTALEEMLLAEIALDQAVIDYIGFLQDWEAKTQRLLSELELFEEIEGVRDTIATIRKTIGGIFLTIDTILSGIEVVTNIIDAIKGTVLTGAPSSVGFSNDVGAVARAIGAAAGAAATEPLQIVKDVNEIAKSIAFFIRDETIANNERNITRLEQVSAIEGTVEELVNLSGSDQPKRDAIGIAAQEMELKRQEYFTAISEGFRLLREREAFNKVLASSVQKNRYQDMVFRLSRNEAMTKYQSSFNHAARYAWLTARAYDYETSLDPGHPASPDTLLDQIVKERQLGLWADGEPQAGQGGLAEILAHLRGNFEVLKGQLGIEAPQAETGRISLRSELFRIAPGAGEEGGSAASDERWENALKARIVPDLTMMPEFVRYCRPFSSAADGPQPGLVIRFSTQIENGRNFFGRPLAPGDHAYSTANFATKIRGFGLWLENYNDAGLSTTPRGYLVPVGNDYLRTSSSAEPATRLWSIHEQRIPVPFVINQGNLSAPQFIPGLNGVDGEFGELRRHGDFRMYHDEGDPEADDSEITLDTRLIGRSVWNSEWLLIIPGTNLHVDPITGLTKLAETVTDMRLQFTTYSHQGQ